MSRHASAESGRIARRNSMDRWTLVPANRGRGHSRAIMAMPKMRLMIWRMGKGLTAMSSDLVRKSQKILGQMKPSMEAPIWSKKLMVLVKKT